jgi:hypothetical protein
MQPYLFFSSRQEGLTLAQQKVTPGNELVIVDADGYALAYESAASLVRPSATADGKPSLARLDELGVPALIPLLASVRQRAENPLARGPWTRRIDVDGTPWRASISLLAKDDVPPPVHGHRGSRERVDGRRGAVDRAFGDGHRAGATADDSVHLVARAQHFTLTYRPGQGGRQDPPLRFFGSDRRQFCDQGSQSVGENHGGNETKDTPFSRHQPCRRRRAELRPTIAAIARRDAIGIASTCRHPLFGRPDAAQTGRCADPNRIRTRQRTANDRRLVGRPAAWRGARRWRRPCRLSPVRRYCSTGWLLGRPGRRQQRHCRSLA